ncbi:MAG: hypothetical protein ABW148_17270 [Sedimenticola sp.]
MNWLIDIFGNTSDQARAITAIFVAAVAITAVFINQWFLSRRARKEKLIEKIEETYTAISAAESLIGEVHLRIVAPLSFGEENKPAAKAHFEALEKLSYCNMLASLYFKKLSADIENIEKEYLQSYITYVTAESLPEYMEVYKERKNPIDSHFKNLYMTLNRIMKGVMH